MIPESDDSKTLTIDIWKFFKETKRDIVSKIDRLLDDKP